MAVKTQQLPQGYMFRLEGVETCSPEVVDYNKTVMFWLPFICLTLSVMN